MRKKEVIALIVIGTFILVAFSCDECHSKTLAGLRAATEHLLGQDTSATQKGWPNAVLNGHVNDAIAFISGIAECIERDTTIILQAGVNDYDAPSTYIRALSVVIMGTGTVIELDQSPRGLVLAAGKDVGKAPGGRIFGPNQLQDLGETDKVMRFIPTPVKTDTAHVHYMAYGKTLTSDTMTCDLPLRFQTAVPDYAAWDAWKKTRTASLYWENFEKKMSALVPVLFKETEQQPVSEAP
jgi:hypothetical protein